VEGRDLGRTLDAHNRAELLEVSAEGAAAIAIALERAGRECAAAADHGFPVPEAIPYRLAD
jgi:hypothetical protein